MAAMESVKGQLLIAGPALWDTNFRRTVVLIGDHDPNGALGVILNRPSGATVGEAVPALSSLVGPEEPLFLGGPVQPESAVILGDFTDPQRAGLIAFGSVGFLIGDVGVEDAVNLRAARVFAGYAGWGPGQLELEMEEEQAWIPERATPGDVFGTDPGRLWDRVVQRKGKEFAFLRTMPFDPSLN
jgi:putative transcriptional regulator